MARNLTWTANWVVMPLIELGTQWRSSLAVKTGSSLSWHVEFEVLVGHTEECPEGSLHGSGIQR